MHTGKVRVIVGFVESKLLCCTGGWRGNGYVLSVRRLLFAAAPPL